MHQQGFNCVADAGALRFGVEEDFHGHLFIRGLVNEDMDIAFAGFDDGYSGVGHNSLDEIPSTAGGNQDIHPAAGAHQYVGSFATVLVHSLHGIRGQAD